MLARIIPLVLALGLGACVSSETYTPEIDPKLIGLEPASLFEEGKRAYEAANLDLAQERLELFMDQFPYSIMTDDAMTMLAQISVSEEDWENVGKITNEYVSLHPNGKNLEMMVFLLGKSFGERIRDPDFDQSEAVKAAQVMSRFVKMFPDSKRVNEAEEIFEKALNQISEKEMRAARYYMDRGDEQAALKRYLDVIENFKGTASVPEALYHIHAINMMLDNKSEADNAASLLREHFSDSEWTDKLPR